MNQCNKCTLQKHAHEDRKPSKNKRWVIVIGLKKKFKNCMVDCFLNVHANQEIQAINKNSF